VTEHETCYESFPSPILINST